MILVLLQGQWISVLIAGTGIFATILSNAHPNANFPLFMNLFNYLLLSTFLWRRQCQEKLCGNVTDGTDGIKLTLEDDEACNPQPQRASSNSGSDINDTVPISRWIYLVAAILDVEANFLVLLAYNYTSITSVMMLDCFTIPCAMGLSYFFLGCRYTWKHIFGTLICLIGLGCIILNDALQENGSNDSTLVGDLLCLSSAVLYASSNVIQETVVKYHDRHQYLGHLGSYGAVIAFIQFMAVDFDRVETAHFTIEIIFSMIGFILCLFFMYTNTTAYLVESDATLFNLSLLTSDVYAVVFSYFFYGSLVSWMYFVAFALVIIGLFVYHSEKPPIKIGEHSGVSSNHLHILTFGQTINESDRKDGSISHSGSRNVNNRNAFNKSGSFSYNPIMDDSIDRSVIG